MSVTRTSKNWKELPGSIDKVNARLIFPSTNSYGIPDLAANSHLTTPTELVPYGTRLRRQDAKDCGLHFYLDDYRFEAVWNRPVHTLPGLAHPGYLLTPDFSLYLDWPRAVQIWNVYRNRWLGAYWQSHGLNVIPAINWTLADSYDFAFAGVPVGSVVAVSAPPRRDKEARHYFAKGLLEMLSRIEPSRVLCYGEPGAAVRQLIPTELVVYPTRWETMKTRIKADQAKQLQPASMQSDQPGRGEMVVEGRVQHE